MSPIDFFMERPLRGDTLMSMTFSDFALADTLKQALVDLEFTTPTSVQIAAIPAALNGKDLLVSSQTGSGKTAAFLLPALNVLASTPQAPLSTRLKDMPAPTVLVLCPTRELAQQVSQDAINLVRHVKGVRIASIMGGMPFGKQIAQLKGAQVVVATPGRLLDLVNRRQMVLSGVHTLILDEADRMLDLGFSEDLEAISDLAEDRKQTLMFSATFADRIIRLAEKMTNNPERIAIETGHSTNTDVTQTLHWTDGFEHKKKLLSHWLSDTTMDQAVVFASTQEDTDMLAEELAMAGHQVVALHGAMPQAVRMRRIRSLREGKVRVLVATDVAARGLDVPTISHVINFGLPMKNEDYVHRIGRTGRAGRTGQAITLATHRERSKIRSLEEYLKARLTVGVIEGLEPSPPPETGRRGAGAGRPSGGAARGRDGGGYRGSRDGAGRGEGGGYRGGEGRGGEGRSARPEGRGEGGYRSEGRARPEGGYRDSSRDSSRDSAPRVDHGDYPLAAPRPAPRGDREGGYRGGEGRSARPEGGYRGADDRGNRGPVGDRAPRGYGRPEGGRSEGGYRGADSRGADDRGNRDARPSAPRGDSYAAADSRPDRPRRDYQGGNRDDRFAREERHSSGDRAVRRTKRED